jgi:quinate dehydrogenase (quinone)
MPTTRPPRIFASIIFLIGIVLAIKGMQLISLGGSPYYALVGLALIVSALLLWRGDKRGAWLYGALLLATLIWSLYEVGFDAWALAPRLVMLFVLGTWLLVPRTRRALHADPISPLRSLRGTQIAAAALLVLVVIGVWQCRAPEPIAIERSTTATVATNSEWQAYGRTSAGTRYAPFGEIAPENVKQLKKAWTFRTGLEGAFKATPLQVGDSVYVCTAGNVVIAIDAESGTEQWRFDPKVNTKTIGFTTSCRGVTYYHSPKPLQQCTDRILTATTDARMFAVDAHDGKPCNDFGTHEGKSGEISLLPGMGDVIPGYYYVTSPATIARDVAVLGGWVLDNNRVQEPSGVIRAFDPLTGRLKWAWDIGRPGKHAIPGEGETFTPGTPNAWSVFSADDELGLVYIPTGNATPDYFGGHRTELAEKYASSVVALDVATGDVRWSYQTTHHDIWDYDVPSQPVLTNVPDKHGVNTPAVIVPTKRGELFVFDRRDGTPLIDIEERAVPQGAVPEDWTAKTQPFATGMPSFGGAPLTERDAWGLTPIDQMLCRIDFRKLRYEGPFTPQSTRGTLEYPGFAGGMNWGSVTVHEPTQLLVVQSLHMANRVQLTPRADVNDKTPVGLGGPQTGTPYLVNSFPWLSPIFVPCQKPPYGEMAVVDLKTKRTIWQRPVGTANELGPLGLKFKLPLPIGVFFFGGTITTQSGLIFVGGTMDRYFRAIDLYTGKELWSDYLPGQAQATPMSYLGPKSKKQFLVITAPSSDNIDLEHGAARAEVQNKDAGGYVIAYSL